MILETKRDLTGFEQVIKDVFTFSHWESGIWRVWQRNFLYFRYKILTSLFWIVFEPALYLVAFGQGLGQIVGQIDHQPYLVFFFPALLANTAMMVAFFESTYGSFTKLSHQKTYATILLSPISATEIVLGEILWAASKSFFGVCGVCVVAFAMGLIHNWYILPAIGVLALTCWVFAALGMLITSFARNYDSFIYSTSGFIIPMSLFSGTYFPLDQLPEFLETAAWILPLTHGVSSVRQLINGNWDMMVLINISVLVTIAIFLTNWACQRIVRKIVY